MPTEVFQIFRCDICGNVVEVVHVGDGQLFCCGKPMTLFTGSDTRGSRERHLPVVRQVDRGVTVHVGQQPHPMEPQHHIEWIEVICDRRSHRLFLNLDDPPEASFPLVGDRIVARASCNLHGLWQS